MEAHLFRSVGIYPLREVPKVVYFRQAYKAYPLYSKQERVHPNNADD